MNINQMIPITVLLFALSTPAAASLVFNIDFGRDNDDSIFNLGFNETTWADIYVSGVEAPGLISMGFELAYDSSALEILSANADGWNFSNISFGHSPLTASAGMLFDTFIRDNILLASVQFKGIAATATTTALTLFGNNFVLENGVSLDSQLPTSGVELTQVAVAGNPASGTVIPQPGLLWLLASGLLGLLLAKNRLELRTKEQ
ncbi:hypothetical protein [Chromatium okenii]|jgi:hypothetical protein|uniref:PEP-CTERM protein-sorting domain-containing protein n=1 Tax=Chromatium okenii TaxID=61644 RepID=A0A2S7XRB2_9GAMM|nr:hypothetical protein [Chromatium okenii]PQJ96260.1 hypothetical protein CXB77_10850 [Chromatium okenii]